ncbi:MAG: helix-turn-helix transcriptional regulator [Clostridia bacterium]|nr:helix-turn-helix transcriptional regulator [Clostridia bacterium]
MNQKELAAQLGVGQNTLSGWESGKHQVDNENLFKMADFFGVSVGYLLGKENKSKITDTKDDTIDVQERLQEILSQLEGKDALMFSGDPLSDDSKELLAAALERAIRLAHKANKSEDDVNEG